MNSAVANAATVPPLDRADLSLRGTAAAREPGMTNKGSVPNLLWLRVVSALVLAPLPVAAIWFGWPWEWGRLCRGGQFGQTGIMLVAIVLAAVAAAALASPGLALGTTLLGAGVVLWAARWTRDVEPHWTALGVLWVALPCICLLWLARDGPAGRATLLWLLAVVWATDIGAYAVGRTFGGPRLAPRWSPRKTWAGLAGGTVCAALHCPLPPMLDTAESRLS